MNFPRFAESLDADEPTGKPYTFPLQLATGDTLSSATIEIVDATSTALAPSPATTITSVAFAVISGTLYGVSFRAQGGVAGFVYVRCRYLTSLGVGDDVTYRLLVEQR